MAIIQKIIIQFLTQISYFSHVLVQMVVVVVVTERTALVYKQILAVTPDLQHTSRK